jgi:hypothetical protein
MMVNLLPTNHEIYKQKIKTKNDANKICMAENETQKMRERERKKEIQKIARKRSFKICTSHD